jgi:hypothetical protein
MKLKVTLKHLLGGSARGDTKFGIIEPDAELEAVIMEVVQYGVLFEVVVR